MPVLLIQEQLFVYLFLVANGLPGSTAVSDAAVHAEYAKVLTTLEWPSNRLGSSNLINKFVRKNRRRRGHRIILWFSLMSPLPGTAKPFICRPVRTAVFDVDAPEDGYGTEEQHHHRNNHQQICNMENDVIGY